ncbi:hypothetical protein KAR91_86300 [Candidatus Pacearchaeota archaeon]|nr:hypothetical protein [Candidatus Pacearchaeota archaeon]
MKWKTEHCNENVSGGGFCEWHEVKKGNIVFRADSKEYAWWLCSVLNWIDGNAEYIKEQTDESN